MTIQRLKRIIVMDQRGKIIAKAAMPNLRRSGGPWRGLASLQFDRGRTALA